MPTSTPSGCCGRCPRAASTSCSDPARTPARWTSATASCAPSRSSRTTIRARSSPSRAPPPASAGSCATSSRSARARSPCSTRCASASPRRGRRRACATCSTAPSSGIGHYGNSIGVPTVGGEVYFEGPYEHNCLVNAMALGLAPRERLVRSAAAGPGNLLVLFGASTGRDGIGGASVLASAELGAAGEGAEHAPDRPGRRPLRGEPAARVLARTARAGPAALAAGPRRRGPHLLRVGDGLQGRRRARHRHRRSAAARGRHGALRGDGLRVPGADAVRRRASRSSRPCSSAARTGSCPARSSAPSPTAAACASCAAASCSPTCPCRRSSTSARCMTSPRRSPTEPLYAPPPATLAPERRAARDAAGAARRAPISPRAGRCSSSTTRSCSRAPCAARSSATPPCSRCPTAARSRSASTATAGASPPTPTAARSRRCSSAPRTSPAPAPQPLGTTNNLNFGNPEKPHIAWQLTEAVRGARRRLPRAAGADRRRQRLALQRGRGRADLPHAGDRHGRRLPDARRAGRLGFRASRRRVALLGPSRPRWPPASSRSCAASRYPTGCRSSTLPPCAPPRPPCARGPRGPARQRPRHRRGRPRGGARRVLPRRRPRRERHARAAASAEDVLERSSARAPAASS